jgi:hypothetical protein
MELSNNKTLYLGEHPTVQAAIDKRFDQQKAAKGAKGKDKFTLNSSSVILLSTYPGCSIPWTTSFNQEELEAMIKVCFSLSSSFSLSYTFPPPFSVSFSTGPYHPDRDKERSPQGALHCTALH